MESKKMNVMINKAGGNAGSNSYNYRISIPTNWAKQLGVTLDDRAVDMEFDGEKIVIKKTK